MSAPGRTIQINTSGASLVSHASGFLTEDAHKTLLMAPVEAIANNITDDDNSKMQQVFNRTVCEELNIPVGYQKIAVLITKWIDKIDELNTKGEVKSLKEIFQNKFSYTTEVLELDNTDNENPQLQFHGALIDFVRKYDGPNSLLIIYYTGHAGHDEAKDTVELYASNSEPHQVENRHPAKVCWNEAEPTLIKDAVSDVFIILDACFASNVVKSFRLGESRCYKILSAAGHGKLTSGPGPKSFTQALINSLEELLEKYKGQPFAVNELCQVINLSPLRRHNQSHIWSRLDCHDRNIILAPLMSLPPANDDHQRPEPTRAIFTLEFASTQERLDEDAIQSWAKSECNAMKKSGLPFKHVSWIKWQKTSNKFSIRDIVFTRSSAKKWKYMTEQHLASPKSKQDASVQAGNDHSQSQSGPSDRNTSLADAVSSTLLSPHGSRKRKLNPEHEGLASSQEQSSECLTPVTEPSLDSS